MHKNGRLKQWSEYQYWTGILFGVSRLDFHRLIAGMFVAVLALYTYTGQTYASSSAMLFGSSEADTFKQPTRQAISVAAINRNRRPFSETNSFTIRARADNSACQRAEQLYQAASADARTLERAIFISGFRREVEQALGRRLSDEELRTLANQARVEAHQWYTYMQQADHGCAASRRGDDLRPPRLDGHAARGTFAAYPPDAGNGGIGNASCHIGAPPWRRARTHFTILTNVTGSGHASRGMAKITGRIRLQRRASARAGQAQPYGRQPAAMMNP